MIYTYVCTYCNTPFDLKRPLAERNDPADCASCGATAKRIFSSKFQVIGDPIAFRGENKYALGFDETTRLETMRADDKAYERAWAGHDLTRPKTETLAETFQKMHGPLG